MSSHVSCKLQALLLSLGVIKVPQPCGPVPVQTETAAVPDSRVLGEGVVKT